jgi:hypothetical protein
LIKLDEPFNSQPQEVEPVLLIKLDEPFNSQPQEVEPTNDFVVET